MGDANDTNATVGNTAWQVMGVLSMIPCMIDRSRPALVLIFLALFLLCNGDASARRDLSDLESTWAKAVVAVPPTYRKSASKIFSMEELLHKKSLEGSAVKFPVVLYMHGCTGLGKTDRNFLKKLAESGFLVIAPDSMARRFRPRQCSGRSKQGGVNVFVFDFRQAEINFALQELVKSRWADMGNLFLVGVSEGGLAVAHYRGDIFRARVITQWTCHGATLVKGITAPRDTPILAVVRKHDPWYDGSKGNVQGGDCGVYFDDRPNSRSIVMDKGKKHSVMKDDEILQIIVDFLKANRR